MVTPIIEDEADTVDWVTFRLVKTALVATISVLLVDDALFEPGLFITVMVVMHVLVV